MDISMFASGKCFENTLFIAINTNALGEMSWAGKCRIVV